MRFVALMNPLLYLGGMLSYLMGVNLGLAVAHLSVFLALAYSLNYTVNRLKRALHP